MTFAGKPALRTPSEDARDFHPLRTPQFGKRVSPSGRSSETFRRRELRTPVRRPSHILRDLLADNPGVEHFTVQRIVASIEQNGPAASLMLFSLPSIVPVPGTADLVGPPTLAVSSALLRGDGKVRLPPSLLERVIPRRALALAIHAVLPVLERAERLTRKRWSWLCAPAAQRAIGILVFLLALPLAFPILGFGLPHATSLFTIALGMLERDGATIALGVTAGIASLVFFTAKGLSPAALTKKAGDFLKRFVRQLTSVRAAATAIIKRALHWLSVKLLSGPTRAAKTTGGRPVARLTSNIRRLPTAMPGGLAREPRRSEMVAV